MKFNIGRETRDFHAWIQDDFRWIDAEAKRLMFKAWCARAKQAQKFVTKKRDENGK